MVEPTHLKNMSVKLDPFPKFRGKHKKPWEPSPSLTHIRLDSWYIVGFPGISTGWLPVVPVTHWTPNVAGKSHWQTTLCFVSSSLKAIWKVVTKFYPLWKEVTNIAFEFGSRELTILKRAPAELLGKGSRLYSQSWVWKMLENPAGSGRPKNSLIHIST